jgi:hypothetical protein
MSEQDRPVSDEQETAYWWSLVHHRVEQGPGSPDSERLGPYRTYEEAETALDRARKRSEAWDAKDREWNGG